MKRKSIYFVGMIVGRVECDWKVDFYGKTNQGTFVKPDKTDISLVSPNDIVKVLPPTLSTETTARTLGSINFGSHLPRDLEIR